MNPELSITKPDPEPPPFAVRVLIETTEGKTLCAIPATESGARSIVLVDDTKLTLRVNEPPPALTPKKPPRDPASSAIKARLPLALFVDVGNLVKEQQVQIDEIADNVETSEEATREGLGQLNQAVEKQKSNGKMFCYCMVLLVIVIFIIHFFIFNYQNLTIFIILFIRWLEL
jgi:hypothetical protein